MVVDVTSVVLGILTLAGGCGWVVDRHKYKYKVEVRKLEAEVKALEAEQKQKYMDLDKEYVEEFRKNIGEPLQQEVGEQRKEVKELKDAVTRDSVWQQVVVAVHDTLQEVTTITLRQNDRGDTLKLLQVTDRTRASRSHGFRDREEKVVVKTDTVYVERRDSMAVSDTRLAKGAEIGGGSGLRATLKWIFAVVCVVMGLVVAVRFAWRRGL